jgi:hypothetical protein
MMFFFWFFKENSARQLVGKTRWVFRQPHGLSNEWNHVDDDKSNRMEITCIGPIRPTEDPAGLPYKLAKRIVEPKPRYKFVLIREIRVR